MRARASAAAAAVKFWPVLTNLLLNVPGGGGCEPTGGATRSSSSSAPPALSCCGATRKCVCFGHCTEITINYYFGQAQTAEAVAGDGGGGWHVIFQHALTCEASASPACLG